MMRKFYTLFPVLACLSACATAPENYNRPLHFSWDLQPETQSRLTKTVEQGDIIFEWKAEAKATHQMRMNGKTVALILAETRLGSLYCTGENGGNKCYEDRDSDQRFDYQWTAGKRKVSPYVYTVAHNPKAIEAPVAFEVADNTSETVVQQTLGLLYNGAMRGLLDETGDFSVMFGELRLGWHEGKTAPRDPSGAGWRDVNTLLAFVLKNNHPRIVVDRLGLSYETFSATSDGGIKLELESEARKAVQVQKEFDIDVPNRDAVSDIADADSI